MISLLWDCLNNSSNYNSPLTRSICILVKLLLVSLESPLNSCMHRGSHDVPLVPRLTSISRRCRIFPTASGDGVFHGHLSPAYIICHSSWGHTMLQAPTRRTARVTETGRTWNWRTRSTWACSVYLPTTRVACCTSLPRCDVTFAARFPTTANGLYRCIAAT